MPQMLWACQCASLGPSLPLLDPWKTLIVASFLKCTHTALGQDKGGFHWEDRQFFLCETNQSTDTGGYHKWLPWIIITN